MLIEPISTIQGQYNFVFRVFLTFLFNPKEEKRTRNWFPKKVERDLTTSFDPSPSAWGWAGRPPEQCSRFGRRRKLRLEQKDGAKMKLATPQAAKLSIFFCRKFTSVAPLCGTWLRTHRIEKRKSPQYPAGFEPTTYVTRRVLHQCATATAQPAYTFHPFPICVLSIS